MKKLYSSVVLMMILCSCGTSINYLGTTYPSTKNIDVFVSGSSVKKPFEIIGKGYVRNLVGQPSIDKIQKKTIEKAKVKGADAVLFEDYYVVDNTTSITTNIDSAGKSSRVTASATPTMSPNFTIKFLRYK